MLINSYGGSGSKFLTQQLILSGLPGVTKSSHKHVRQPFAAEEDKIIFVISDPVESIVSFFSRRYSKTEQHGFDQRLGPGRKDWVQRHCENIQGDSINFSPDWDINDYVDNGVDLLRLDDFLNNWLNHDLEKRVFFIKYEALWREQDSIMSYLAHDPGSFKFAPKKNRTSSLSDLDPAVAFKLNEMYFDLSDKIKKFDDTFII